MAERPSDEDIAAWAFAQIDLPTVQGAKEWRDYAAIGECDYCGDTPVYPARPDGSIYDGDPAVCVTCGSVYTVSADAEGTFLSDAWAVLRKEDHERLHGLVAPQVSDG
jgi:hypothetical protein